MADLPLKAALQATRKELATWLDTRFREEITAAKWPFPTPPQVRDIVASGRLRDSQEHTVTPEGDIQFTWSASYAAEVHEGGVSLNGQRFPGRPWTRAPLEEMPAKFTEIFARQLKEKGR